MTRGTRPTSHQREEAIRLLELDLSVYEVAAATGVTPVTLYAWARKFNIPISIRRSSPGRKFQELTASSPLLIVRFLSHIEFCVDGCWRWTGDLIVGKYGRFIALDELCAHRVSYRIFKGPIPEGLEVDHLCSYPPCVNPFHLEAVTPGENKRRAVERRKEAKMTSLEFGEWITAV